MAGERHGLFSDLHGLSGLLVGATHGVVDIVGGMHEAVLGGAGVAGLGPPVSMTRGITGLVLGSVHGVTALVGAGLGAVLGQLAIHAADVESPPSAPVIRSALNGVLGDWLAATGNPLAISMQLRRDGRALELERRALAAAMPQATRKALVLIHGLGMTDGQWTRQGHDHGLALERDHGFTAVHVHYNTGLHVSANGRRLAELLEQLVAEWPVDGVELAVVGFSMGGLVARSACVWGAEAGHRWLARLRKLACIGTPHHGTLLERGGSFLDAAIGVSRYSAPFAALGRVRSAGVTDMRYGSVRDEDWRGGDRFARRPDARKPAPLPAGVECYAMAASCTPSTKAPRCLLGDGLVPLASALGRHRRSDMTLAFPPEHQWIARGTGHLGLLSSAEAYDVLARWLS